MVIINAFRSNLRLYIPLDILNKLPLVGISLGITIVTVLILYVIYKGYARQKNRFRASVEAGRFVMEQKDNLEKWIDSTEKRIKKNNLKIKAKRYIFLSIFSFLIAFVLGIKMFKNVTATILFSAVFLVIPEYLLSLYEDSIDRKIEDQLAIAIRLYTAEFIQKKPIQKIFSTMSTKINDPVGKYFSDAYYELITGSPVDVVLSRLTSKFNSNYGKMFIQLIHQSQKNSNVINLFPELLMKIENHIELSRNNKTSLAGDRLQAFIMSLLPIPAYFAMSRFFPETKIFVTDTYYGRLIITLSFLSIFVFIILDRFIRRVE